MQSETLVKHPLSAEVEAASRGRQTVLQTAKGQPTYMNVIKAFRCEEIGTAYGAGLHPAFIVNGVQVPEIYIGTYQAVIRDGEALSLPGQDPAVNVNFDESRAACIAAGHGFHLLSNLEWAAIALWCEMNGLGKVRGNTDWGRSHENRDERCEISKDSRTLTGSGPASWRHDAIPYGIADLVGNVWEWVDGLKTVGGEIFMAADNSFNLPESDWPSTSAFVDLCDGMRISSAIQRRSWNSHFFSKVVADADVTAATLLKQALISSAAGQSLPGRFWVDNTEGFEALPFRGGDWNSGDDAGLAALTLGYERGSRGIGLGFRPAFIP